MNRNTLLVALFFAFSLVADVKAQDKPGLPDMPHITVVGHGEAEAVATSLEISFRVAVFSETQEEAKSEVDTRVSKIAKALKRMDLEMEQIDISELTLDVDYDYDEDVPVVKGYTAKRKIDVTLSDFTVFDAMIEAAVHAGVTSFYRPVFHSAADDDLKDQALSRAIENAKAQARSIAVRFGMKAGKVYSITTSQAYSWGRMYGSFGGGIFGDPEDDDGIRFTPGPVKISQQVYATFLLEDAPLGIDSAKKREKMQKKKEDRLLY